MKKAVVTGANGFVGRHLMKELAKKGYETWAVLKDEKEDASAIIDCSSHIILCDLGDLASLKKRMPLQTYNCFYHLAWAGSSGGARADYHMQIRNAEACVAAAEIAAEIGCQRFVGAGSVTELMYGKYFQEDGSRPEMTACYAVGKIAAEYMSRCVCAERGIDFLWGYLTNFYGVGDMSRNIINILIQSYLKGEEPILTDGEQCADFLYVSDVARALLAMGERGKAGNTYYVGYGQPRPLREFVLETRDAINPRIGSGLGMKKFQGMDIDFEQIDISKLKRDTGFVPKMSFTDGICETIGWFREKMDMRGIGIG